MTEGVKKKKLYSFYIDQESLDKLERFSFFMFMKSKGKPTPKDIVPVSKLIRTAIDEFLQNHIDEIKTVKRMGE